jgi:serine/threonine protein kinase/CRP-like cAMP-binding protein
LISKHVNQCVLFAGTREEDKEDAIHAFEKQTFPKGAVVIKQHDAGHTYYVIQSGTLDVTIMESKETGTSNVENPISRVRSESESGKKENDDEEAVVSVTDGNLDSIVKLGVGSKHIGVLEPGDAFGELALMYNTPRAATITALEDVVLWKLDRSVYRAICMHHTQERGQHIVKLLKTVPILEPLSSYELDKLSQAMELTVTSRGEVVIKQGEKGDYFYIVADGELDVTKTEEEGKVTTLSKGQFFGEKALLSEETRAATVTSKTACELLKIKRQHFSEMLGDLVTKATDSALERQESMHEKATPTSRPSEDARFGEIKLDSLTIKRTLGCGAFGRVRLVRHEETGDTFALKCLIKADVVNNNLQEHVMNERDVMLALDHPFILKLYSTYNDSRFVYLLLELVLGGEMFTHLRRKRRFNDKTAKFYSASVLLAMKHLHSKNILYRDLKPENLLIDKDGFLKMADFGLAKFVTDRTWTLCGTPEYLAPEIILYQGHNTSADHWAFGVFLYEISSGTMPFYDPDPMEIYELILAGEVRFPNYFTRDLIDAISKLLVQNQARRLGNLKGGIRDIQNHRWFTGIDWDALENAPGKLRELREAAVASGKSKEKVARMKFNCGVTPPIIPAVTDAEDTQNFDDYPEGDIEAEMAAIPICTSWNPDF